MALKSLKSRPVHDRVVIRQEAAADTSKTGLIHIPEGARERPYKGTVVAVGDGRILENGTKKALDVKVGDVVLYGKFSGTDIELGDDKLKIMREDEVLMICAAGEDWA